MAFSKHPNYNADWALLTQWLVERNEPIVTITWSKLDEIVGGLPNSATKHYPQWWHGDRPNTRAWRRAGYELVNVERGQTVTLVKTTADVKPQQDDRQSAHPSAPRQTDHGQLQHSGGVGLETIDPRSALIVLPCSSAKERGGTDKSAASPSSWSPELLLARDRLRDVAQVDDHLVMPAWQRYTGGFYQAAGSSLAQAVSVGANIAILSGGYGVVHAEEEIGWYNRMLIPADWPHHVLENALLTEAIRVGAQDVVAFAAKSTGYATIIRRTPWHMAGIRRAVLVTAFNTDGSAMREVPRLLGEAFDAFWSKQSDKYPKNLKCEELV